MNLEETIDDGWGYEEAGRHDGNEPSSTTGRLTTGPPPTFQM